MVWYTIGCLCGNFYINQTGRSANTRIKEHMTACRLAKFESSAVAEHAWLDGLIIEWDQVEIMDTAVSTSGKAGEGGDPHQVGPYGLQNQQR